MDFLSPTETVLVRNYFLRIAIGILVLIVGTNLLARQGTPPQSNLTLWNSGEEPDKANYPAAAKTFQLKIETATKPREKLLAKIKLIEVLRSYDLRMALKQCEEAIALASQHGLSGIHEAMLVDRASIRVAMFGENKSSQSNTDFKLPTSASPEIRLYFALSKLNLQIQLATIRPHFQPLLNEVAKATAGCKDKELLASRCSLELFARLFFMDESLDNAVVDQLSTELSLLMNSTFCPRLEIISLLMKARKAKMLGKSELELTCCEEAKLLALELGNRELAIQAALYQSEVLANLGSLEKSITCLENIIPVVNELESDNGIRIVYKSLAHLYGRHGHEEDKFTCLKKIEETASYKDLSIFDLRQHTAAAYATALHLGKTEEARKYKSRMPKAIHVREYLAKEKKLNRLEEATYEQRQFLIQQARLAAVRNRSKTNDKESGHPPQSLSLSFIAILIGLGFGIVALLFFRKRINGDSVQTDCSAAKSVHTVPLHRNLRSQRLESLGQMAGNVAHDFNNILVGVLGNAEIIQLTSDAETYSQVRQHVDSIVKSAERAASLSQQMLAYSGRQFATKELWDLNTIVSNSSALLKETCQPEQDLEVYCFDKAIPVNVDVAQIEKVLLNLVANAVAASPIGCNICIRTGVQSVNDIDFDHSFFGTRNEGGEFGFLEVLDEGAGFTESELERIFEPFYSTSSGQGLGLAVVYGVVIGHDGLIKCRSISGEPTSFRVLFPLDTNPKQLNLQERISLTHKLQRVAEQKELDDSMIGKTVLVVDDEESVLEYCQRLLDHCGIKSILSLGGKSGLENIIDFQNEIDCILMDISMPVLGAKEILAELENRHINIPVVLMTGHCDANPELFLTRKSVISVLEKPFTYSNILTAIQIGICISIEEPTDSSSPMIRKS